MKTQQFLNVAAVAVFTWLFYQQLPGINVPIFVLILTGLMVADSVYRAPGEFRPHRDRRWRYYSALANVSAFLVFLINSDLSIITMFGSVFIMAGRSTAPSSSLALTGGFAGFSVFSAIPYALYAKVNSISVPTDQSRAKGLKTAWSVLGAVAAAMVLFITYRGSNPLFNHAMASISFEWMTPLLLFTVFSGFAMVFGLTRVRKIAMAETFEQKWMGQVQAQEPATNRSFGLVLFSVINLMLLVINVLDILNLYAGNGLPENVTLSEFVHEAVRSLIFSIVIGTTMVAVALRGSMGHSKDGRIVRLLVKCWILQSALMVIHTLLRNSMYVAEYQLTHLRIGVYFFLILSLAGLVLTWLKVQRFWRFWQMVSYNFEIWLFALVMMSAINWDRAISRYNIAHATDKKPVDVSYLLTLSNANLPELKELYFGGQLSEVEKEAVREKAIHVRRFYRFRSWQSWSCRMEEEVEAASAL